MYNKYIKLGWKENYSIEKKKNKNKKPVHKETVHAV